MGSEFQTLIEDYMLGSVALASGSSGKLSVKYPNILLLSGPYSWP